MLVADKRGGDASGVYYHRDDSTDDELWYDAEGNAVKSCYENDSLGDVTLTVPATAEKGFMILKSKGE